MRISARSCRLAPLWVLVWALFTSLPTGLAQDEPKPSPAEAAAPVPQPTPPAQDEQAKEDLGPMSIEVDLDRLLFDTRGNNVQDTVWRLQPSPGRQILLLPFTVDNVHRSNKLSRFPITVRAGRFIGFVIPKTDLNEQGGDQVDLTRIIRAAPGELQELLFSSNDEEQAPYTEESPDEEAEKPTPEGAPRIAREITLHADGTVQWAMDRSIKGAELQGASEQNPYAYKIDPEQLRAKQPARAERLTRNEGEDARAYAERKRAHQTEEREKQNEYRELRDMLRRLPEYFREPAPSLFYAAIEIPTKDTLSLEGPAPYPWNVDPEKKQLLDELSRNANALAEDQGEQLAGRILTMIQGHPLDARAIALATNRGRLASQVKVDDPGYKVLAKLLQSNDIPTRRIALYNVATVNPPSLVSAKLVGVAGEAALGEERKMLSFASLGKLFSTQSSDPDNARVLIDRVSQTISDPDGPAAPKVVQRVLAALDPGQSVSRGETTDEATAVMIDAVDLTGMEADEFDGVAKAIIREAPHNPVAAGWLDRKLLASPNHDLVNKTLAQLYELEIIVPKTDQPFEESGAPEPVLDTDTLVITGTIPMTRADHALIGLFDASDDLQQAAAWAVLGRFHIALPEPTASAEVPEIPETPDQPSEPAVDPAVALFESILNKANEREKVPASVVAFILNQKDPALTQVANDRFVALLADEGLVQKTARAAVEAYIVQPDRFTQSIGGLAPADQMKLMQSMYRSQDQEAPLMAGLIADRGTTMNWLTGYVKENKQLPTPEAWVELAQTQGESSLLQSAASEDVNLATAAASAMVIAVGGSRQQELGFAQTVALMESREYQLVKAEWDKHRAKIFASAFKTAAGAYKLVVTLTKSEGIPGEPSDESSADEPPVRIDLGIVQLKVEEDKLSLSAEAVRISSMTDRLGIRLENPDSLRSFSKPELTKIAPEHLSNPTDLVAGQDGAWVGETALPDGRVLGVSLEPAN